MENLTLRVSEIFYSLAGEGARAGEPSIFVRLQGCSAKHACYASGVLCDTEFESGQEYELTSLHESLVNAQEGVAGECKWVVFTGGEPMDQLQPFHLEFFKARGYKIALETSGIKSMTQEMADLFDHITISPKVAEHVLAKHFGHLNNKFRSSEGLVPYTTELRYVRHAGQPGIPQPSLIADYYYLSPHSDGAEINQENLKHCVRLCLENPQWRLSVQYHKMIGVL